jgi:hypothetical protein
MQWAIFAVRNILEMNETNQMKVASMSKSRTLIDSPMLAEMGFKVIDGKLVSVNNQTKPN